MRNIVKRILGRGSEDQKGFTLIELLIVVGIIVALAAVIIPLVIQFAGKGQEGAKAAELDSVQTAIDAMMTDKFLTTIIANTTLTTPITMATDTAHSLSTETIFETGTPNIVLSTYLREAHTQWCYTWADTGVVTAQSDNAVTDATHPLTSDTNALVCP